MSMTSRTWRKTLPLLGFSLIALSALPAAAHEGELGGFIGAHFFSDRIALGRSPADTTDNRYRSNLIVGIRGAYLPVPQLSLEGEVGVVPTALQAPAINSPVVTARAHAMWNILTGRIRPFILFGGGVLINTRDARNSNGTAIIRRDADGIFYTGLGFKFDLTENFGFRLDGRFLFPPALLPGTRLTTDYEVLWSLYGRIGHGPRDRDKDGVTDDKDRCPKEAGPKENNGCPDKDADGDGIVDRLDKCPMQKGVAEHGGCPEPDTDGDGIFDREDKCPREKGIVENGGCPDRDSDGDGIIDRQDKCPMQKGIAELGGCPDPDSDGDGITDRQDKCPKQPETKNGYQDEDGCPDQIPQQIRRFTGIIRGINFASGKDVILASSYPTLDAAAKVLTDYPDVKLEISGHTDTTGTAAVNTELSQKRAEAVKRYLEGKGVAASRLQAKGYGPSKPVADNKTAAGRAKNRRVEFQLVP